MEPDESQADERALTDPLEVVDLGGGRRLEVRHGRPDDADDLLALYRRLPDHDRWLRFFTVIPPARSFLDHWLAIADAGGVILLAFVEEQDGRRALVAEVGYSLLHDGDGELGIVVDPQWRGWLGPWLLGVLLREAAARGVPNLQADVQVTNRNMMALLRQHHAAVVDRSQPDQIRLVVGTAGGMPGWPPGHDKSRILVEAAYGRWAGEDAAHTAGFEVRTCLGPRPGNPCPLLAGEECPLASGADAVVMLLPADAPHTEPLLAAHERSGVVVVVPASASAGPGRDDDPSEVVAGIRRFLGLAEP